MLLLVSFIAILPAVMLLRKPGSQNKPGSYSVEADAH
jgi:hypothetical protein